MRTVGIGEKNIIMEAWQKECVRECNCCL